MKHLRILAASLLSVLSAAALASPVMADTTDARCDVFPRGEDRATSSGLCSFSQRQGFVSIQLKNGTRIELKPNESTPNAFFDEQGEPARREILEANRGHVYRLASQSIFVFWDTAPYKNDAARSSLSPTPGSGSSPSTPPEITRLVTGNYQVKIGSQCRIYFTAAGKRTVKTSACDAQSVDVAEDAMRRYRREQGL